MLVLCPSAYGLTAVTKFGRDNIVVGGRGRQGGGGDRGRGRQGEGETGREGGKEGTKIEEFYKNLFTVIETNT